MRSRVVIRCPHPVQSNKAATNNGIGWVRRPRQECRGLVTILLLLHALACSTTGINPLTAVI